MARSDYGRSWEKLRRMVLRREPICRSCLEQGQLTPANEVDHIIPINRGGSKTADENLQPLCKPCHSQKTIRDELKDRIHDTEIILVTAPLESMAKQIFRNNAKAPAFWVDPWLSTTHYNLTTMQSYYIALHTCVSMASRVGMFRSVGTHVLAPLPVQQEHLSKTFGASIIETTASEQDIRRQVNSLPAGRHSSLELRRAMAYIEVARGIKGG